MSARLCGEFGETQFTTDTKKRSLAGSNLLPAVGNVARRGEVAALAGQRVPGGGHYLDAHGARRSSDPHVDEEPVRKDHVDGAGADRDAARDPERALLVVRQAAEELRRAIQIGDIAPGAYREIKARFDRRMVRLERKNHRPLLDALAMQAQA